MARPNKNNQPLNQTTMNATTKLSKKQEIINSLSNCLSQLADQNIQYCQVEDLEYSFTDPNNQDEELVYMLELYSQQGSQMYEDKIACKWLKENGYLIKNSEYQLPEFRPSKWIIKTF